MSRQNKKKEKTAEDYRRDIFLLKNKIKQQQLYLDEMKQKCSQVDIFSQQSYTFQMKIKILQNDLAVVKDKIYKYSREEFSNFYALNFCVYALSRACTIIGMTPEMVFRAIDIENKGKIKEQDLATFFREVLRLDSTLFNPILNQLNIKNIQQIQQTRYVKLLKCFMIDSEKSQGEDNEINAATERVCIEMMRMQVLPHMLWDTQLVNIATTAGAIKYKLKSLDTLDCVAVYLRCDPTKQGAIESEKLIKMLEDKCADLRRFAPINSVKGKLKQ